MAAPRKRPLRSVAAGEVAPSSKPLTLLEAVESGNYRAELMALHRRIASAVSDPNTPARDLAALTRRQMEISKEINALVAADRGDEVGDAASTPDEALSV